MYTCIFKIIFPQIYPKEYQNSICQNLALEKAAEIKTSVERYTSQGSEQEDIIASNLLGMASNTMTAVNLAGSSTVTQGTFNASLSQYIPTVSNLSDPFSSVSLSSQAHMIAAVENAFTLGEDIASVTLKAQVEGENPVTISDEKMTVYAVRRKSTDIYRDYSGSAGNVVLHEDLLSGLVSGQDVFQIYVEIDPNPFNWGQNSGDLDTQLLSLSVKNSGGSSVSVQSLSDDQQVTLVMPNRDANVSTSGGDLVGSVDYDPWDVVYSYVDLDAGTLQQIELTTTSSYDSSTLHVQLRFDTLQNTTTTDFVETMKVFIWKDVEIPSESNADSIKYVKRADMVTGGDHKKYTIFIRYVR